MPVASQVSLHRKSYVLLSDTISELKSNLKASRNLHCEKLKCSVKCKINRVRMGTVLTRMHRTGCESKSCARALRIITSINCFV